MLLRTFATAHERRAILPHYHTQKTLVTGIGPEISIMTLTQYLTTNPSITHIVNIGLAGWHGQIDTHKLYHIRTARHHASDKEYITTHTLPLPSAHCICFSRPTYDVPIYNKTIYPGILVDMESRAIGRVAQRLHRSSLILKIPYDNLGTQDTQTFDPQPASTHLSKVWINANGEGIVTQWYKQTVHQPYSYPLPQGIHASHSQKQQRQSLALSYYALTKKTITDQEGRQGLAIDKLLDWARSLCDEAKLLATRNDNS
ncbi:MAG: hypothetical protein NZL83_02515 [Candidatus Absconditabacterales bacterium]|nr:hypothetical protein [Candidatus Absconditabacterales bacterium]